MPENPQKKIRTTHEIFISAVSKALLMISATLFLCSLYTLVTDPELSGNGRAIAYIMILIVLVLGLPFLIIFILALIYSALKKSTASPQVISHSRISILSYGAIITIISAPVSIIVGLSFNSLSFNSLSFIVIGFGISFFALLFSNLSYAKILQKEKYNARK